MGALKNCCWEVCPRWNSRQVNRRVNQVITRERQMLMFWLMLCLTVWKDQKKRSSPTHPQSLEINNIRSSGTFTDPCQYTHIHTHGVIPVLPALLDRFLTDLWGIHSAWKVPTESCLLPDLIMWTIYCSKHTNRTLCPSSKWYWSHYMEACSPMLGWGINLLALLTSNPTPEQPSVYSHTRVSVHIGWALLLTSLVCKLGI